MNIPESMRRVIIEKIDSGSFSSDIFDAAIGEVLQMMYYSSFKTYVAKNSGKPRISTSTVPKQTSPVASPINNSSKLETKSSSVEQFQNSTSILNLIDTSNKEPQNLTVKDEDQNSETLNRSLSGKNQNSTVINKSNSRKPPPIPNIASDISSRNDNVLTIPSPRPQDSNEVSIETTTINTTHSTSSRLANNPFIVQDLNTTRNSNRSSHASVSAALAARNLRPAHNRGTTIDIMQKQSTESISHHNSTDQNEPVVAESSRTRSVSHQPLTQLKPITPDPRIINTISELESEPATQSEIMSVRERQDRLKLQPGYIPKGFATAAPTPAKHFMSREVSMHEFEHGEASRVDPEGLIKDVANKIKKLSQAVQEEEGNSKLAAISNSGALKGKILKVVNKPVRSATVVKTVRKNTGSSKDYLYEIQVQYVGNESGTIHHTYE
ncbi:hypothetical protein HK096_009695, partial [Nowakowskiella sp. JEL0078]